MKFFLTQVWCLVTNYLFYLFGLDVITASEVQQFLEVLEELTLASKGVTFLLELEETSYYLHDL